MIIRRVSLASGKIREMDLPVTEDQMERWKNGGLIQDVMPHLSKDQREFIISGCTQEEWDELWKEGEDDESGEEDSETP
jgi:hypothetical protein